MVKLEGLNLFYPPDKNALKDISFNIDRGECVLLTGESGSGKSSIINSINGLVFEYDEARYRGNIFVADKNIKDLKIYEISKLIFSVFQNPKTYFFNVDTTNELIFYLENIGLSREEITNRIEDMLSVFPISDLLDRNIFDLSGGQKQILCIAAAYISGAKVIVLDEPSSNLDYEYTMLMAKMLEKLKQRGITIIISEHRIFYLMNIVDKVFLLENGELIKKYTIDEFKSLEDNFLYSKGIRSRVFKDIGINSSLCEGEVEIKYLKSIFKDKKSGICINDICLKKGKIYGVIGRNGIGKSTFIKSLIGVQKNVEDKILIDGRLSNNKKRLKMSSLVFQDVNHQLFTDSVLKEVLLGNIGVNRIKAKEILKRLDIEDLEQRHPMSLSGGQKQRVAIASALLSDALILCFDECTSGMDYRHMVEISELIRNNIDDSRVILITSHDNEFLNMTADYIIDIEKYIL